ncbi:site-specific integrase [Aquimarina pacifica]|uniref:hypothetical protein n=1 Tax=Aquimarina pacifica TaxID=1296415 RepID=UPI000471703A|nr:hypothetical protein [Aquimarina pacifica]
MHNPFSGKATTSKTLEADEYENTVIEAREFSANFSSEIKKINKVTTNEKRSMYLFDAQLDYLDFYADIGVPEHKKKNISKGRQQAVARVLKLFNEALEVNNIDKKGLLRVDRLNDMYVGYFHKYLDDYAANTYNRMMYALGGFYKWALQTYRLNSINPFESFEKKVTVHNKETITEEEFEGLLKQITPENGKAEKITKSRIQKLNWYTPYLKDAFRLAIHTGGRREEIYALKWNMIKESNGKPIFIEIPNLKVMRNPKFKNKVVPPKIIPITKGFKDLIDQLGYQEYKGSDQNLIFQDRKKPISTWMKERLSGGFSHFYKQLNTGKELDFKCLRKTLLTYLKKAMKGDARLLSSHSTDEVLDTHYVDHRIIDKAIKEFQIFY